MPKRLHSPSTKPLSLPKFPLRPQFLQPNQRITISLLNHLLRSINSNTPLCNQDHNFLLLRKVRPLSS
jgi:hypothetical protein